MRPCALQYTSVVINLNATMRAADILNALSIKVEVTETVLAELEQGEAHGHDDCSKLRSLLDQGIIDLVPLSRQEIAIFHDLSAGSAGQTLDDGESSTIARTAVSHAVAAIDDKKASKLFSHHFHNVSVVSTAEMLLHEKVRLQLGNTSLREAVYQAAKNARISVPHSLVSTIVNIVGKERAGNCPSLRIN